MKIIVRAVNKTPQTSVSDITNNLHMAEVKVYEYELNIEGKSP